MIYESHVAIGKEYADRATGRIGTATAINFRLGEQATVRLEWRAGDQQREQWIAAGRLDEYFSDGNGVAI